MKPRRVVITGIGAVSPLGLTARETWASALEGRSGIGPVTQFDVVAEGLPVTFAGEVKGFDPHRTFGPFYPRPDREPVTVGVGPKDVRKMGRFIQLAMVAGLEAYGDSGLDPLRSKISPDRLGVNVGVGMGGLPEIEEQYQIRIDKGIKRISPFFVPQVITNLASGQLSILLNLQGPNVCNVSACTSSAHSIGESYYMILRGDADVMLAGGAESTISPLGIGGFSAMKALSTRNDAPEKASRPFDKDRDGFVMGEGAAVLVLEEYEHARARGAKMYAEVVGYGLSGDAHHMTSPAPQGEGGYRAMVMALKRAGIEGAELDYVNAHGTSTPAGDFEEAAAIARLVGPDRSRLHVSSTKSMTGHLLGAAGAVEALFCTLALLEGVVPPTLNLDALDERCAELGIDFTAHRAVRKPMTYALSNSFGFGGTNASLILKRVDS